MVKGSQIYSYSQLEQMLKDSKNGQIKIAHNTVAHFVDNERIAIKLYYTDIIVITLTILTPFIHRATRQPQHGTD